MQNFLGQIIKKLKVIILIFCLILSFNQANAYIGINCQQATPSYLLKPDISAMKKNGLSQSLSASGSILENCEGTSIPDLPFPIFPPKRGNNYEFRFEK